MGWAAAAVVAAAALLSGCSGGPIPPAAAPPVAAPPVATPSAPAPPTPEPLPAGCVAWLFGSDRDNDPAALHATLPTPVDENRATCTGGSFGIRGDGGRDVVVDYSGTAPFRMTIGETRTVGNLVITVKGLEVDETISIPDVEIHAVAPATPASGSGCGATTWLTIAPMKETGEAHVVCGGQSPLVIHADPRGLRLDHAGTQAYVGLGDTETIGPYRVLVVRNDSGELAVQLL